MYLTRSGPTRSARAGRPLSGVAVMPGVPIVASPGPLPQFASTILNPRTGQPYFPNAAPASATPAPPDTYTGAPYIEPQVYTPPPLPTSGRIIQPPSTNPNTAGTPVPANYPTTQIYVDPATGTFYEYSATQNSWVNVGVPYNTGQPPGASSGNTYAGTPVPSTQPTSAPYRDSGGNYWVFNGQAWANMGASGYFPGTSIPISTPTNELYTDTYGNQWAFSNGNWQLVASPSSTTAALAPSGAPASSAIYPGAPAAAPESGTQSLLDWFSQSTLVSGVPNWVLAAGAGIVALKLTKGGKR